MASYNGHRSWNAWNVSLWIANDEPMYRCAMSCLNRSKTIGQAVSLFFRECVSEGDKTPDGGVYNRTCVREALAGLKE